MSYHRVMCAGSVARWVSLGTVLAGVVLLPRPASPSAPASVAADVARIAGKPNEERRAALIEILKAQGLEPAVESFAPAPPCALRPAANVVVALGPSGAVRTIAVGAHYDAARLPDGALAGGVVDNAAGVVLLTRLARALAQTPPRSRVHIVFFDEEECRAQGSAHYLATHPAPAAYLNVDVAAYGDTVAYGPAAGSGSALVRPLREACAAQEAECLAFAAFPGSDHLRFLAAGVPSLCLSLMPRRDAHLLWVLLNGGVTQRPPDEFLPGVMRHLHSPSDTIERLAPEDGDLYLRLLLDLVQRLAAR